MKTAIVILLAAAALLGCRREDIRTFTIEIPGLTEANRPKVVEALSKYQGVVKESYVFDFQKKTLTLSYDSMQIAQTNIRMAIADKGVSVTFPPNRNGQNQ